jgi:hypothetical protein
MISPQGRLARGSKQFKSTNSKKLLHTHAYMMGSVGSQLQPINTKDTLAEAANHARNLSELIALALQVSADAINVSFDTVLGSVSVRKRNTVT